MPYTLPLHLMTGKLHSGQPAAARYVIPDSLSPTPPTTVARSFIPLIRAAFRFATLGKSTSYTTVRLRRPMSLRRKYRESKPAPKEMICRGKKQKNVIQLQHQPVYLPGTKHQSILVPTSQRHLADIAKPHKSNRNNVHRQCPPQRIQMGN